MVSKGRALSEWNIRPRRPRNSRSVHSTFFNVQDRHYPHWCELPSLSTPFTVIGPRLQSVILHNGLVLIRIFTSLFARSSYLNTVIYCGAGIKVMDSIGESYLLSEGSSHQRRG